MAQTKIKRPRFEYLFIDLYGIDIYWVQCDRTDYASMIQREFKMQAPELTQVTVARFEVYPRQTKRGRRWIGVLWFSPQLDPSDLAHECLHVAHYFLDLRGMTMTHDSEEAYAYLIGHLFYKIHPTLNYRRK